MKADIRVYGILDPAATPGADLASLAHFAAKGGATILQLRDKLSDGRLMVERARSIIATLSASGVPLLINDRVDVAIAAEAQGVHLGQTDIDPKDARAMLGGEAIIGRTLTNDAHIDVLRGEPVDYGVVGGVFPTRHKADAREPIGLEGVARLVELARALHISMPIGAIAGIDEENAAQVIAAGADGIAVIGAIFSRPDPQSAAQELRRIVDGALALRASKRAAPA